MPHLENDLEFEELEPGHFRSYWHDWAYNDTLNHIAVNRLPISQSIYKKIITGSVISPLTYTLNRVMYVLEVDIERGHATGIYKADDWYFLVDLQPK